jgi:hypothetical protein
MTGSERTPITFQDIINFGYDEWGNQLTDSSGILHKAILGLLCEGIIRRNTVFGQNSAKALYRALGLREEGQAEDFFFAAQGKDDSEAIQAFKTVLEARKLDVDVELTPPFTGKLVEVDLQLVRYEEELAIAIPFSRLAEGHKILFRRNANDFCFSVVDRGEYSVLPSTPENIDAMRKLSHHGINEILVCDEDHLGRNARGNMQWDGSNTYYPSNQGWVEISDALMNWVNGSHRPAKE